MSEVGLTHRDIKGYTKKITETKRKRGLIPLLQRYISVLPDPEPIKIVRYEEIEGIGEQEAKELLEVHSAFVDKQQEEIDSHT